MTLLPHPICQAAVPPLQIASFIVAGRDSFWVAYFHFPTLSCVVVEVQFKAAYLKATHVWFRDREMAWESCKSGQTHTQVKRGQCMSERCKNTHELCNQHKPGFKSIICYILRKQLCGSYIQISVSLCVNCKPQHLPQM